MATDLGLDAKVKRLQDATDAGEWLDALEDLLDSGFIAQFAGTSLPSGWLLCDGSSVSRSTYADLYQAIGTRYGGSGSSFNVPDLRRRVPIGRGGSRPTGSAGPGTALGDTGGEERRTLTTALMARHNHRFSVTITGVGQHQHTAWDDVSSGGTTTKSAWSWNNGLNSHAAGPNVTGAHTHRVSSQLGYTGAASPTPMNLMSKTLVMNYMIKV